MNLFFLFLSGLATYCSALPFYYDSKNVVTVPPNCPVGQQWVNGQCRDIWRLNYRDNNVYPRQMSEFQKQDDSKLRNFETFNNVLDRNVVTVPTNCPDGQEYVNGQCRDIWRRNAVTEPTLSKNMKDRNVVTVPTNCPDGQEYVNGQCRDIWRGNAITAPTPFDNMMDRNVVSVPTNCPDGQEYVNGQCRDIWRRNSALLKKITSYWKDLEKQERQTNLESLETIRGIISVPNQCPTGQRPDALGICRPILD